MEKSHLRLVSTLVEPHPRQETAELIPECPRCGDLQLQDLDSQRWLCANCDLTLAKTWHTAS